MTLGRLGGQAEAGADGVDLLQRLSDGCLIDLHGLPSRVDVFLADTPLGQQRLAPFEVVLRQMQRRLPAVDRRHGGPQVGDLVFCVLDGVFELEAIGPRLGDLSAHLGLGRRQVRLGHFHGGLLDRDLNLVRLLVELHQDIALFHAIVFLDQEANDVAGDRLRGDVDDVGLDKGVLGDRVRLPVGPPEVGKENHQPRHDHQAAQPKESEEQRPRRGRGRWDGSSMC